MERMYLCIDGMGLLDHMRDCPARAYEEQLKACLEEWLLPLQRKILHLRTFDRMKGNFIIDSWEETFLVWEARAAQDHKQVGRTCRNFKELERRKCLSEGEMRKPAPHRLKNRPCNRTTLGCDNDRSNVVKQSQDGDA